MIAVYSGILWILLQVSSCPIEEYSEVQDFNNTMVTLYRPKKLHSAYGKGFTVKPFNMFGNTKVWVPAVVEKAIAPDCQGHTSPTSAKVARLMLEMFRNLEGNNNILMENLVENLIKSKVLVEASLMESVSDYDDLARTYATFARVMSMLWLTVTDPFNTRHHGWCSIDQMSKYLSITKPAKVTSDINAMEQLMIGTRNIIETFIEEVGDTLSAESSESYGRRHGQDQVLIRNNANPRYPLGDSPDNGAARSNQKSRHRRQESHYQVAFDLPDDLIHKHRRHFVPARKIDIPYQERRKSHYKMVRVVSEAVSIRRSAPRKYVQKRRKKSAGTTGKRVLFHPVLMFLYLFILQ